MIDREITYQLMQLFYKGVVRQILLKTIMDTKTEWDDTLLEIADKIFEYKG